jgi:hypothetical protein
MSVMAIFRQLTRPARSIAVRRLAIPIVYQHKPAVLTVCSRSRPSLGSWNPPALKEVNPKALLSAISSCG